MNLYKKLNLDSSIGLFVRLADRSLERAIDFEIKERFSLTGSHWKILMILAITDGINQRKLADLAFVESPTLVPILDRMEKLGLITRKASPTDRRVNQIFLTPKSKKLVSPITERILNFRKMILENISERDLVIAHKVLQRLSSNADNFLREQGGYVPENILSKNN